MVDITDDVLDKDDETFLVKLSHSMNATIADQETQGTIRDNDALPALTIKDLTSSEDDGIMLFTVSLSGVSGRDVSVS